MGHSTQWRPQKVGLLSNVDSKCPQQLSISVNRLACWCPRVVNNCISARYCVLYAHRTSSYRFDNTGSHSKVVPSNRAPTSAAASSDAVKYGS